MHMSCLDLNANTSGDSITLNVGNLFQSSITLRENLNLQWLNCMFIQFVSIASSDGAMK